MTPSLVIRPAQEADLPEIVRMLADDELGRSRERVEDPLPKCYLDAFQEIARDPRHELVVVEQEGSVVGTAQLSFLPSLSHQGGERAQVEAVRVAADRRDIGIGRELLTWMIARAEERGCRMVQLTTDKSRSDAHRFYESIGFQVTHHGMKLRLPRAPEAD